MKDFIHLKFECKICPTLNESPEHGGPGLARLAYTYSAPWESPAMILYTNSACLNNSNAAEEGLA